MAVYKPNYCYPYLEPVDLTIPDGEKYFTCQIDTSNIAITGYKIEVYDENNTLVFPNESNKNKISPVSELPIVTNIDGLNGSELRIPFIQHYDSKITASYNAIYFKVTQYVDYYQLEPLVKEGREFKIGDNDQLCVKEKDSQTYEPMVIDGSLIFVGDTILAKDQLYTVTTSGVAAAPALTEIDIIYVKSGYTYAGSIFQYKKGKWVESTDGVWVDCDEHQLSLSNKGKTYKWQITLYSGSKGAVTEPEIINQKEPHTINYDAMADSEFDTLLTSGTILGSTEDRIQGPISDKIYAKQWLQLLRKNDKGDWLQVGTRTYIESYSQSLGHIYPVSGGSRGFSNDDLYGVNPATHFAVYKYSNDPEHMTSQNSVDQSINFELTASGASYTSNNYSYEVIGKTDIDTFNNKCKALNTTPLCNYKYDEKQDSYTADYGGQSVLIWNEENPMANPLTGYFTINFTTSEGVDGPNTPKFTFLMAYAYRKISSYIGKVFFVKDGSFMNQNIVSKAEATGDNDILSLSKPITFIEEEPLEIYPNSEIDKFHGEIFKNSAGKVYVSPFVGLQAGARLYVSDGTVIKATEVDTTNWAVTYIPDSPASKEPYSSINPLKYEIRTNFKSSDETPFYAYDSPRLVPWVLENLAVANEHGHEFLLESGGEILTVPILCSQKVERRYIEVGGQYLQAQNKSWTSYRWLLVDAYGNIIQDTGKQYDGAIRTTFYGLDGPTPAAVAKHEAIPNVYYIVLIVEDELGNVLLMGIKIEVTIDPTDLIAQFSGEFDCKTHSVKLGIQDYGYPTLSKDENNQAIKLGDVDGVVTNKGVPSYVGLQGVDKGENDTRTPSWKAASKMALPLEGAQLKRFFKYKAKQITDITQTPSKMVANKEGNIEFHTQVELDANFCGDIFTYVVDIGDHFGNTDKLRISLVLPENFLTSKGGDKA